MEKRLSSLRYLLNKNKVAGILIASPLHIGYLTDYFGFSLVEREAYIVVTKNKVFLLTDRRYTDEISEKCPTVTLCELSAQTPLPFYLETIAKKEKLTTLGFEPEVLTVAEYKRCRIHDVKLTPMSLRSLRITKDKDEIACITTACEIGDKTFNYIQKKIKLGMTELEVASLMEDFIRQQSASLSFATIVAFGKNAAIPHHHTDNTKLKSGDEILLDFGVKYNNYCSDMTRTIYVKQVSDEQKKIYETVKTAQEKAVEYLNHELRTCLPAGKVKNQESYSLSEQRESKRLPVKSIKLSSVDKIARDYIISKSYPSIPHGLGHGIGLEVHESPSLSPRSEDILSEGMVFSIEPGIYFTGTGGVRIEDLFVVQKNILIQLTNSSKNIIIL